MSKIHLLKRFGLVNNNFLIVPGRIYQKVQLNYSSSSSEDEKHFAKKTDENEKSNEALKKLNNLLKTMIEEDVDKSGKKLNLAKPPNKREKVDKEEKEPVETPERQISKAVKDVAESFGGDVKQTESELLMKLLKTSQDEKSSATNLADLVKGMQVDNVGSREQTKAQQVRQILQSRSEEKLITVKKRRSTRPITELPIEKIDLFGSEPLGIFTNKEAFIDEGVQNKTWNNLYQKDLKLAVTHPPSNYFQQMILWTEQEKVWKFPIDNEQGLEEEKKVYFTEHVFLEKHLEPWCPPKGPLRHFMELVCVGLSKNPYLTVEAKKEHIEWFKKYFEDKKQLLKEVGAIQNTDLGKANSSKQITQ